MSHSRRHFIRIGAIASVSLLPAARGWSFMPPSEIADAFLEAVIRGDVDAVARMVEQTPSLLQTCDHQGRSAFAVAWLHHQPQVARLLRHLGHQPDAHEAALANDWDRFTALTREDPGVVHRDHPIGGTPMYAAALGGAGNQIWRVYAALGDPNLVPRGAAGTAPLQAALQHPDLGVAEITAAMLLGNGADPNPGTGPTPPLHLAAHRGSYDIVEMLLRLGSLPGALDGDGHNAESVAKEADHIEVVELLRHHRRIPRSSWTSRRAYALDGRPYRTPRLDDLPLRDRSGFVGAAHFNLDSIREMTAQDRRFVHSRATTGELAVEACVHTGHTEIVDFLLERGAPYSLLTAVMRGDTATAVRLLDENPDRIHERGPHDFALLWYPVIGRNKPSLMRLLLDRGAEVEAQHYLGTTALHFAAMADDIDMIELLVEHGADIHRRGRKFDPAGQTPLDIAQARGHTGAASLLTRLGASSSESG